MMPADTTANDHGHWDHNITGKTGYLDINFRELWHYRDLLMLFVKKDVITVYKQTVLGPVWYILQPIMTTIVFVVVFGRIAEIKTGDVPSVLFYLGGLAMWNYFSETLSLTAKTFTDNANIFGKVYFPRLILPLSKVVSGIIKFLVQFALFLIVWVYYYAVAGKVAPNMCVLLVPVLLVIMAMMSLGFGLVVTSMTTKYRDLAMLITFGVQLLMYATPVIYPMSSLDGRPKLQFIMKLNPLSSLFETFKYGFFSKGGSFEPMWFAYSVVFTLVLFIAGVIVFNKAEKQFIDTV